MELVKIENNKEYGLVVSSRVIANRLRKKHKDVLESIDFLVKSSSAEISAEFIESKYKDSMNRTQREYLLTKDGFTLYMFNIQGHNDFKMAYINKFNEMSNQLTNPALPQNILMELVESQKRFMEQATRLIEQSREPRALPAVRKRRSQNTRPLLIETFPPEIQEVVDVLIVDGYTAGKIRTLMKPMGYSVSENAIRRYMKQGGAR